MPGPPTPRIAMADLDAIAGAFGLGDVLEVAYLPTGLMNRNWQLITDTGRYALKQIIDVPLPTARRNLHTHGRVVPKGIPVCPPVPSAGGDPVVEVDGRGYCLLPWRNGTHLAGPDLSLNQARELGIVLGRIHQALNAAGSVGLPPASTRPVVRVIEPEAALAAADRCTDAARASGQPFDLAVIEAIGRRTILIDMYAAARLGDDQPRGPFGWTHGDVQYRNLLWQGGHLTAVLDWDRIRVRPFAEEVARTATIQFGTAQGLDLARVAAFVAGYRTVMPISVADLADGVHRKWWTRMSDFWHLDFHYDRDDHGCDDLFLPGEALLDWWSGNRDAVQDAFSAQP